MNTKPHLNVLQSNKLQWINPEDFEGVCFSLAKEHFRFNEHIPDFITRSPGILESCLKTPMQRFEYFDPYPTLIDKLSIVFYLLIKNHPFQNGNKRIAVVTLFAILYLNNLWLKTAELEPYKLAIKVAGSKMIERENIIKIINEFIKLHCVPLINN